MIWRLDIEQGQVLPLEWPKAPPDGVYKLVRDRAEERRRLAYVKKLREELMRRRPDPGGNIQL